MINKTKFYVLILLISLVFGCSKNRFKNYGMINSFTFFTFGKLGGHDDYEFCKKHIPNFIGKYSNNINPSRICIRYQYYVCHIAHYCNGDKTCEEEAAQYWTPLWDNAHGDLEKRVSITKKVCDKEQQRNSGSNLEVQSQNKNSSQNSNNSNSVLRYDK